MTQDQQTFNARVNSALDTLKSIDPTYFNSMLEQRLSGAGAGSIVSDCYTVDVMEAKLRNASWIPHQHPALVEGTVGFETTDITGYYGIYNLNELHPSKLVTLDDRKNTGNVSAIVHGGLGNFTRYTMIILGKEDDKEIVFTFHPGEPVSPSTVPASGMHGKVITIAEAMALGLTTAKIVVV